MKSPILSGDAWQRSLAVIILFMGLGSVVPLLAWVYGLGSFATWLWAQAAPGLAIIFAIAVWSRRPGGRPTLAVAITAGVLGGLAATIAYDVVRLPFLTVGYRLFAPISSYGLLMTGASHSDRATEILGWFYNFSNGIGFGVAYAMLFLGRRWWWAIPWALWLETMTVVTPYAGVYGLAGHLDIIALAFGAHVFYGIALGKVCERAGRWRSAGDAFLPPGRTLIAVVLILVALGQPWLSSPGIAEVAALPAPAVVVHDGRFEPEWTRLGVGDCLTVVNRDAVDYRLSYPMGASDLTSAASARYCFTEAGIKRVQLNGAPYSGGFVIVDPALQPREETP